MLFFFLVDYANRYAILLQEWLVVDADEREADFKCLEKFEC